MTDPNALRQARRWLASEIATDRGAHACDDQSLLDACYAGKHDDDPRLPGLIVKAERQLGCPSHASDAIRRNDRAQAGLIRSVVR